MVFEFRFPDVGEGITEGEIVKWLVKPGDKVKEDQVLGQIETDKAVVDIPSPKSGTILKLHFKEGEKVKVGQVIVTIGEKGEKVKQSKVEIKKEQSAKKGQSVVGQLEEAPDEDAETEIKTQTQAMLGEKQTQKVLAAPAVRKKAAELHIDLIKIKPSGSNDQILMKDLISSSKFIQKQEVPQQTLTIKKKYDDFGYIEYMPLKGIRKTIADHMLESVQKAPQVTSMEDIDVTKLWDIRNKEKIKLEKQKIKLTFLPFIIKASIAALKENPVLNSTIENDDIIIKKYFNIGIATETPVGLMVPVVKIAQNKNIRELAKEIEELTEKARTRKIDIMDLKGGTFTITNYGSVGGTYGVPIINYPEAAILGLGRIFDRTILDKNNKPKNIKILPVSLTFDHRILDGAQAARFLESLKTFLEDPNHFLLDSK